MAIEILAGTAILNSNKVLLTQLIEEGEQNGRWGPPAGHGIPGESLEETAKRETKEETNLDVNLLGIAQAGILSRGEKDYAMIIYVAEATNLSDLKLQANEASSYAWVSLEELRADKYRFRKKLLKEPMVLALTRDPLPLDSFKVYVVEEN